MIVAFSISPITVVLVMITVVIAQLVYNLYLILYVISTKGDVDPLLSILLPIIFADILGALGMILSIPAYVVYKVVLTEF